MDLPSPSQAARGSGRAILAPAAIGVAYVLALLPRLGDAYLWTDEAKAALFSRTCLRNGYPSLVDGPNRISEGVDASDWAKGDVYLWETWLHFYVTSAAYALVGESAASARLPGVLAAAACLAVAFRLALRVTARRNVAWLTVLLLGGSMVFVLHGRQCRYYTLAALLVVATVVCYIRFLESARLAALGLAASSIALFHTFIFAFGTVGVGLALHFVMVIRSRALWRRALGTAGCILLLTGPFLIYSRGWARPWPGFDPGYTSLEEAVWRLRVLALQVHHWVCPLWLLPAAVLIPGLRRSRHPILLMSGSILCALAVFIGMLPWRGADWIGTATVVVCAVLLVAGLVWTAARQRSVSAGPPGNGRHTEAVALIVGTHVVIQWLFNPAFFLRYFVPLLPLLALAVARMLVGLTRRRAWLAAAVAALLTGSNLLQAGSLWLVTSLVPAGRLWPAPPPGKQPERPGARWAMLEAWSLAYRGPRIWWAEYLGELTHDFTGPMEAVCDYLDRHARPSDSVLVRTGKLTAMFHTRHRVLGRGDPVRTPPNWIVLRRHWPLGYNLRDTDPTGRFRYDRLELDATDTRHENRPDPYYHHFRTLRTGPPVILLRRQP